MATYVNRTAARNFLKWFLEQADTLECILAECDPLCCECQAAVDAMVGALAGREPEQIMRAGFVLDGTNCTARSKTSIENPLSNKADAVLVAAPMLREMVDLVTASKGTGLGDVDGGQGESAPAVLPSNPASSVSPSLIEKLKELRHDATCRGCNGRGWQEGTHNDDSPRVECSNCASASGSKPVPSRQDLPTCG